MDIVDKNLRGHDIKEYKLFKLNRIEENDTDEDTSNINIQHEDDP